MTESNDNKKKREIDYHAPVREFDNTKNAVTNIGFTAKSDEKFQIIWLIPETDEECQERYDSPLSALIEAGVRQLSTRPDYKSVGFYTEGDRDEDKKLIKPNHPLYGILKDEGHEAMQALADSYEIGKRTAGVGQKVMAQKAKKAEEETGMSIEEQVRVIQSMKERGLLNDITPDETE